jgi:hypothetical protein
MDGWFDFDEWFVPKMERGPGKWLKLDNWLPIAKRLVEFDSYNVLFKCEAGLQLELVGARMADDVECVTIGFRQAQFVFYEHEGFTFDRCELHLYPAQKTFVFVHRHGMETEVDLMMWLQHQQRKHAMATNLNNSIPAHSFHNHFCYHSKYEDAGKIMYTHTFLNRAMRTLGGTEIESGGVLTVSDSFLVLGTGEICPLPAFSPPNLDYAESGMLGIGVRGCASLSTDTLAQLCEAASAHFDTSLLVFPVDINDNIRPCAGCNNDRVPCMCELNARIMAKFTFLSHLCLVHNSIDEPYGQLASALWVTMPHDRTVTMEIEGGLVRVRVSKPAESSALGGGVVASPPGSPTSAHTVSSDGSGLDWGLGVELAVADSLPDGGSVVAGPATAQGE